MRFLACNGQPHSKGLVSRGKRRDAPSEFDRGTIGPLPCAASARTPASVSICMSDDQETIGNLRRLLAQFIEERAWEPFHTPKNLSMALAVEAAELMEHFQWLDADEAQAIARDPVK